MRVAAETNEAAGCAAFDDGVLKGIRRGLRLLDVWCVRFEFESLPAKDAPGCQGHLVRAAARILTRDKGWYVAGQSVNSLLRHMATHDLLSDGDELSPEELAIAAVVLCLGYENGWFPTEPLLTEGFRNGLLQAVEVAFRREKRRVENTVLKKINDSTLPFLSRTGGPR